MATNEEFTCIQELIDNPVQTLHEANDVLIRICKNILKNPDNPRFRSISVNSAVFVNKLVPANGAISCLFEMGFCEGSDNLILPQSSPINKIEIIHQQLLRIKETPIKKNALEPSTVPQVEEVMPTHSSMAAPTSHINDYLRKVQLLSQRVLQYEDRKLLKEAIKCIPLERLHESVQAAIRHHQKRFKENKEETEAVNEQELSLIALINWFKADFFQWVDSPHCDVCRSSIVKLFGSSASSQQGIDRIEMYQCLQCNSKIEFPRYNDARELLHRSRRGRCGEWANCFTLLCRAMGWDARLVMDETDHAWTEVYLSLPGRWVHCDPCEGVVDCPLMYEAGWKKRLNYILAFSCEEVQDVTWRYSSHHKDVLRRRKRCSELELVELITSVREERMKNMTTLRRDYVIKRCISELMELMIEKKPDEMSLRGRVSGALEWRKARGEISEGGHIWHINESDMNNGVFILGYSAAKDEYTLNGHPRLQGWDKGMLRLSNVHRKVEHDWKMVYVARQDAESDGTVQWLIELNEGLAFEKLELIFESAVFETGRVDILLSSDDVQVDLKSGECFLRTYDFQGKRQITISATLSGGQGDVAWQHAQLFRQSSQDLEILPFLLTISTKLC